jgi:hypothetical protein
MISMSRIAVSAVPASQSLCGYLPAGKSATAEAHGLTYRCAKAQSLRKEISKQPEQRVFTVPGRDAERSDHGSTGLANGYPEMNRKRFPYMTRLSVLLTIVSIAACSRTSRAVQAEGVSPSKAAVLKYPDAKPIGPKVQNSIFITSGKGGLRPFTISRVFTQGEIIHFAKARVNGGQTETQCDVKTRWPDGSVQHALISFWAPGSGTVVDFVDQDTGLNDDPLKPNQMLSDIYDFAGKMELTANGKKLAADARQMLTAGAYRYWIQGQICTQVIIEDRSDQMAFDLGWNQAASFHPIFVATFYKGWRGVKVEMIGENAWTTKMQHVTYSLVLSAGNPLRTQYSRANFTHLNRTRWRKVFWSGPEPERANIDYNLMYLVYSKVVPNYDLSRSVSKSAVADEVKQYMHSDHDELDSSGQWQKEFGTTGGRPDIGLFPRWSVRYLYTFDPLLLQVLTGNADCSGSVPMHFRESAPGKVFHKDPSVSATGRVVSINARPQFVSRDQEKSGGHDRVTPVTGDLSNGGWQVDLAHQGSFVYLPYLITGDWYYLEELYFWSAMIVSWADWDRCNWCRQGDWGIIYEQLRGEAWAVRTLGHTAFFAPDDSPEKAYFTEKLLNNLAWWSGIYSVGSFPDGDSAAVWKYTRDASVNRRDPLYFLEYPGSNDVEGSVTGYADPSKTYFATPVWTQYFMLLVWGHLSELGYPSGDVQRLVLKNLLHQLKDPEFNPYLASAYYTPVGPAQGVFFQTWGAVRNAFVPGLALSNPSDWTNGVGDVEHGYVYITYATSSFLTDVNDGPLIGQEAWNWMTKNVPQQDLLNDNPKWALVPRIPMSDAELAALWKRWTQSWKTRLPKDNSRSPR